MHKRFFDIVAAGIGLLVLSPVLVLVAIWVKIDSPGPIFFRQLRVGHKGVPFRIHKFRTMKVDAESKGQLTIGTDSRVTRSGRFLRKSKVDELPQLIDVLFGKMSIVGPRPEVPEFIGHYSKATRERILSVRPGITDKASIEMLDENQLLGEYSDPKQAYIHIILPIKEKYYLEYVATHSFWGDIKIILNTLYKILDRRRTC